MDVQIGRGKLWERTVLSMQGMRLVEATQLRLALIVMSLAHSPHHVALLSTVSTHQFNRLD